MLYKILVALAAVVVLGCVPVATNALAAGHPSTRTTVGHASAGYAAAGQAVGGHPMAAYGRGGQVARYGGGHRNGPIYNGLIYDSCPGYGPGYAYGYGGCEGYGGVVGGLIDGVLGGYSPY